MDLIPTSIPFVKPYDYILSEKQFLDNEQVKDFDEQIKDNRTKITEAVQDRDDDARLFYQTKNTELYNQLDMLVRTWILTLDPKRISELPKIITDLSKIGIEYVEDPDLEKDQIRIIMPSYVSPSVLFFRSSPLEATEYNRAQAAFPIWRSILTERKVEVITENIKDKHTKEELARLWYLMLNRNYMQSSQTTVERLEAFLLLFDIRIIDREESLIKTPYEITVPQKEGTFVIVLMPNNQSPSVYIIDQLELGDITEKFKPRDLTSDEINKIVSIIPPIPSAIERTGLQVQEEIRNDLREQLEEIQLTPLAITDIMETIEKKYYQSKITPGDSAGNIAVETISAPLTQMALKTFHVTGSSKTASTGIDAVKEVIELRKIRKFYNAIIHFNDKTLTFDDIANKREDLVEVTIGTLLKTYEINSADNFEHFWWEDVYLDVYDKPLPPSKWMMRLYLDTTKLYIYKVTPETIVNILEDQIPKSVTCIASPINLGIIDLYPNEEDIIATLDSENIKFTEENAALIFLMQSVKPVISSLYIKGIPGILRLFPASFPTLTIVYSYKNITPEGSKIKRWKLTLNEFRIKTTGIPLSSLFRLLRAVNIKVTELGMLNPNLDDISKYFDKSLVKTTEGGPDYLIIEMPEDETDPPNTYIQKKIDADSKSELKEEEEHKKKGDVLYTRPPTAISSSAKYYYAETDGTNLGELISRDEIDSYYTSSNDYYEILDIYGIEAARNFLLRALILSLTYDGSYLDPRHLTVLVDSITYSGVALPPTHTGVSKQQTGPLTKAPFDRAGEILSKGAKFGETEEIRGNFPSLFVGQGIEAGTGSFDVFMTDEMKEQLKERQKEIFEKNKLDANKYDDVIDDNNIEIQRQVYVNDNTDYDNETADQEVMGQLLTSDPNIPFKPQLPKGKAKLPRKKTLLKKEKPVRSNLSKEAMSEVIAAAPDLPVIVDNGPEEFSIVSAPITPSKGLGMPTKLSDLISSSLPVSTPSPKLPSLPPSPSISELSEPSVPKLPSRAKAPSTPKLPTRPKISTPKLPTNIIEAKPKMASSSDLEKLMKLTGSKK